MPVVLQHDGVVAKIGWQTLVIFCPRAGETAVLMISPPGVGSAENELLDVPESQ